MASPDIFLSYNREDAARAKQFAQALEAEGFSVWWDATLRSGEAYDQVTENALAQAGAVIVLWSPRSVASRWVRAEATEALRAGKLVPATIEPCKRPIMFELVQTAELTGWHGDRNVPAWRALVQDTRACMRRESGIDPGAAQHGDVGAIGRQDSRKRRKLGVSIAAVAAVASLGLVAVFAWTRHVGGTEGAGAGPVQVQVMAFQAAGTDPDETSMAHGITDELIIRLRRVPGLRVVSGLGATPSASEPSADHWIAGGLRMDGDSLRVSARLADEHGNVLWSNNFDRQVNDLFQVQEDIARAVANELSVSLDVGIESRDYGGTDNTEAYADFVQGRAYRYDPDRSRPTAYLERAVSLDPDYIKAWAELSYDYGVSLYSRISRADAERLMAQLDHASSRARELNPQLWIGESARAWYDIANDDLRSAAARYRHIAQLDRGDDPDLRQTQAIFAQQLGRVREAGRITRSMALIDPIYRHSTYPFLVAFYSGRYEDALKWTQEKGGGDSQAPDPQVLYWAHLMQGEFAAARDVAAAAGLGPLYEHVPDFRFDPDYLPNLPADQLKAWADRTLGYGGRRQLIRGAMFASHFGHQDVALEYLRLAYQRPGYGGFHLLWYPGFAGLRQTSGFVDFLNERGIIDVWRESGDWGDFCKPGPQGDVSCS